MSLFLQQELNETSAQCVFDKMESKHIVKVLRKTTGDLLQITNGKGWLFEAVIIEANAGNCIARIERKKHFPEPDYKLHLAVAPTKMNDRYEWFLEKATEIGISSIIPIRCEHSERKVIKPERYEKIILSAVKQSQQYYLPELKPLLTFEEYLTKAQGQKYIAHCENTPKNTLKEVLTPGTETTIFIGPEGDFSVKEIQMALQHGCIPVSLGNHRLRTETAAVVACHSVAFINA
ncbi:MAG TPA: 16S rRNA (uracil(1498)-N(3))-methyltransferase [Flavobacteriaceae bacterium]|nr:16S rRNA (uracil(1498)-N(3))-methyltransferase [Flavobacteriaceae bacterium]